MASTGHDATNALFFFAFLIGYILHTIVTKIYGGNFDSSPRTSEPGGKISDVLQSEHLDETGEIATEIVNLANTNAASGILASEEDHSKSPEIGSHQLGKQHGIKRYITNLRLECAMQGVDLSASDRTVSLRLVIIGGEAEEGKVMMLERESPNIWRQMSLAELAEGIKELAIVITFGEWEDLTDIWFTKDELSLASVSHGARIEKIITPKGVISTMKLSFALAEGPQEAVRSEAISLGESLQIAKELDTRGLESFYRFKDTDDLPDIEKAVLTLQLAVQLTPTFHHEERVRLNHLGLCLRYRFRCTGNLRDISGAISAQQQAIRSTPDGHADMGGQFTNLGTSFILRFGYTGALADISDAISYHQQGIRLTPDGHADMPVQLANLGSSLESRFLRNGDLNDISEAISLQQRALEQTPYADAEMPLRVNSLGTSFLHRFNRTGDLLDIAEAISLFQRASQIPDGHAHMAMLLNNLGVSFTSRFERTGNSHDISEAISLHQRAAQLTPDGDADMPRYVNNLGVSLMRRFTRTGNLLDISDAISCQRRALELIPNGHATIPGWKSTLGLSLVHRSEQTGNVDDILEAIAVQQQAIQLTPNGHAEMPAALHNLGHTFMRSFERTGNLADISSAISLHQRAVQLTPDCHTHFPSRLNSLSQSLLRRFERTNNMLEISEAISLQQRAIKLTPDDHSDLPSWLNGLGLLFMYRFKHTGEVPEITEAISLFQRAIQLTPHDDLKIASRLTNLGLSFMRRSQYTADLNDISEAISCQQRAIQLTPNGHAHLPLQLSNLGTSLRHRFERNGDLVDISEAISFQQRAVELTPIDHAERFKWLNHLAMSLLCRFDRTHNPVDIKQAISSQQHGIQLTPKAYPDIAMPLSTLGVSLIRRFESSGDMQDLSEAISLHQRAVELTPEGDPEMPSVMNNLGYSFLCRFQRTSDQSDISKAISFLSQAVQLTPNGHPQLTGWLNNLGLSYAIRFQSTIDFHDAKKAESIYQQSTSTHGPPSLRLAAARRWGQLSMVLDLPDSLKAFGMVVDLVSQAQGCGELDLPDSLKAFGIAVDFMSQTRGWGELYMALDPPDPLKAFGIAVDLISQVAGMHRTIEQRHSDLVEISRLTTTAASAAFARGELEKVLEWLEQGRCLVWNQLNQLRTSVDNLREHDDHLAERFLKISSALESSGSRHGLENFDTGGSMLQRISLQEKAHIHLKLSNEWSQMLEKIRQIPRFHDFLRPPRASYLLSNLPLDGAVILVNVCETRCDSLALITGSNAPMHIPLPNFTHKLATALRERLRKFLSARSVRMREEDRGPRPVRDSGSETQSEIHFILEILWLNVVRPILDALAYPVHARLRPPRIWWCPTGPLAFLPLHAAGIYHPTDPPPPGSCVSDFVVSSYTPTVSALLEKVKDSVGASLSPSSKLLIVSQSNTPGQPRISGTTEEMNVIVKTIGREIEECLSLEGEAATVSRVKSEMESYGSIHFACHASQNVVSPLKSGFYLHDGRLELAEIMNQRIAYRELAFLSACQTSTGDEKLSEEAVHLAAGMLAVGYRSVVATMWSIKDKYGPVVAEGFYKHLVEKEEPDELHATGAAHAIHHAIQGIRKTIGDTEQGLLIWVPYVHFGY